MSYNINNNLFLPVLAELFKNKGNTFHQYVQLKTPPKQRRKQYTQLVCFAFCNYIMTKVCNTDHVLLPTDKRFTVQPSYVANYALICEAYRHKLRDIFFRFATLSVICQQHLSLSHHIIPLLVFNPAFSLDCKLVSTSVHKTLLHT